MDQSKTRSAYWDNIKGILMLLTVFAHVLYQLQDKSDILNGIVDGIYMFHMPAFVFVSGFFGKSERSHGFPAIIRLIFLYFVCNSIMGFIYGCHSLITPMYSFWYLLALIVWRLTTHHIAKFKEIRLILFALALFAGFYGSIDNTFAVARIIGFYPFYIIGYQLSTEKAAALVQKPYGRRCVLGLAAALVTGCIAFAAYRFFDYTDDSFIMAAYGHPIDAFGRIAIYAVAFGAIYALRLLSPDRPLPLLTMIGRNSLWIFLLHRPFTLMLSDRIEKLPVPAVIAIACAAAILLCVLFGNEPITKYLNRFADKGAAIFTAEDDRKFNLAKGAALGVALWFIVSVVLESYSGVRVEDLLKLAKGEYVDEESLSENNAAADVLYPVMNAAQQRAFDNAFRLTFAGDLILLEDQVKRAETGSGYDFSEMFAYAKPYIESADLAVGVFEGPMAGSVSGYTNGNFDDGKSLRLNFPDAFADAVKDAGFDLVTTANNHLTDMGEDGARRTLDVLDQAGLAHTGSYRDAAEKASQHIKLIECSGIRMAVLSYTYGTNNTVPDQLIDGRLSYLTSVASGTEGEDFEKLKAAVEQDFRDAKALNPDLIVVLPHMGTQFSNEPDEQQKVWFGIFKQNGADIILGDHAHAVQPAMIEQINGKNVFTAYCPGNFANLYRENQGDISMLTEVYIDRSTKKVIGGSIVPLYTYAPADGNYRAVPVCEFLTNDALRAQLTTDDIERAAAANKTVTNVVFGHEMDLTAATERYYFNDAGFLRSKATGLALTDEMKNGTLYQAVKAADSICFVGDSVTEGTKNGGCPWYEPLEEYLTDKKVTRYAKGGCTVSYMIGQADSIPAADLYVIALGTNDVRYRDESICAMTAESFTAASDTLRKKLLEKSPNAKFVFIAPWYSVDGDPFCNLSFAEKTSLNASYADALSAYCQKNGLGYINANGEISAILQKEPDRRYLLDHIHPNASAGVLMYTEAVLRAA